VTVVVTSVVFTVGCSKAPQTDIDAARSAFQRAQTSEAEVYAPDALREARNAQDALQQELTAQEGKFALFRSYGKATELAAAARTAAETAATEAARRKEEVRQETSQLIAEVQTLVSEVQMMLESAPKAKGSSADIQILKADLATAQTALTEAQSNFEQEKFQDAQRGAELAKTTALTMKSTLEEAQRMKAKTGGARKS
jgi:hypothetical protein